MNDEYRVLHVCNYSAPYRGNFIDCIESLEKNNEDVTNFYLFPCDAKMGNAKRWIGEMNRKRECAFYQKENVLFNILMVWKLKKKYKINRVICHFADLRMDVVLKLLFNSKRVIRFLHNGYKSKNKGAKHQLRKILWKNNKLVGVSHASAREIKESFPNFKVVSIVNAINFNRLDKRDCCEKKGEVSALMMGWSKEIKGVDLAVQAVKRLENKYDITLSILAGGCTGEVREWIEQILGNVPDWIVFLPPTNNMGTYYFVNDIFLSPSRQEAFGYAPVEATYCQNSIVLSKVDGQGELEIDGAYWVDTENLDQLTEQLEKAIIELKTAETQDVHKQAKIHVQQRYSLKRWAKDLRELL